MEFVTPAMVGSQWPRRNSSAVNVVQRLSSEILRKLKLAGRAQLKEDAEMLCEEVFVDLTGNLEAKARQVLQTDRPCSFFEILADYYDQNWMEAERLLEVCRVMWGQSYVAAIFTLLLHKWILENSEAGGQTQRHKHLNVLLTGCRQLFWTDIHSDTFRFRSLFDFIRRSFAKHTNLPIKNSFLPLIGQFLPYYCARESLCAAVVGLPFDAQPSKVHPWMSSSDSGFTPDALFLKITELLKQLGAAEPGLVRYLEALRELKNCSLLHALRTVTRLQFQAQLYSLTSQGGPRYPSPAVQRKAFDALDALYPAGARTRKVISQLFKILHPLDWPRTTAGVVRRAWRQIFNSFVFIFWCITICFRFLMKPFFG